MKPYLLLDVDGVLCPFGFQEERPEGYDLVFFGAMAVWVAHDNTERLKTLRNYFDLVWCTSWEDDANDTIGPYHEMLAPLPVVEFFGESLPEGVHIEEETGAVVAYGIDTWKLPWVKEWVGDRPLAWIDDELGDSVDQWAAEREQPTLLVHTEPHIGLTQEQTDGLIEWGQVTGTQMKTKEAK